MVSHFSQTKLTDASTYRSVEISAKGDIYLLFTLSIPEFLNFRSECYECYDYCKYALLFFYVNDKIH